MLLERKSKSNRGRKTHRQRGSQTKKETWRHNDRQKTQTRQVDLLIESNRHRERQRHRVRERERKREREKREGEGGGGHLLINFHSFRGTFR